MKLIVSFGDDDNLSFSDDTLRVRVKSIKNIKDVINSSFLRNKFIEEERTLLEMSYDDEDIINDIIAVRDMPFFEDFSYFESIKVSINSSISLDEVYDYLKEFPYLVIINTDDMDLESVYNLVSKKFMYEPLIKNIYNTDAMCASEIKSSLDVVFDFAKRLNDRSLSPLEKIMFLYDYLKTRIYKEDDDYSNSASLSKVTLGDSIVCLGYANLFSAIANLIDVPTDVKIYGSRFDKTSGHATVVSYINDDKYNFHSFLEFDPTWDAKKNEMDNEYVSKYYWFGLAPVFSEKCKKQSFLFPLGMSKSGAKLFKYFNNCTELLKAKGSLDRSLFITLFKMVDEEFSKLGYTEGLFLLQSITSKDVITKKDIDLLHLTYLKLFENNLRYDDFLKLLYFVRRSKFVFDDNYELDFDEVVNISRRRETRNNFIAYILFNDRNEYSSVASLREFGNIPKNEPEKLEYDKRRLELVKSLRGIVERKSISEKEK